MANDTDDPTWTGWDEWLAAFSVAAPKNLRSLRCSFYTEAIYAALNGQGIALGWKRLGSDLLHQNRLVRLMEASINTRAAYFVVVPRRKTTKPCVGLFIDGLKNAADSLPTTFS
eukprot:gene15813-15971_t